MKYPLSWLSVILKLISIPTFSQHTYERDSEHDVEVGLVTRENIPNKESCLEQLQSCGLPISMRLRRNKVHS